MIKFRKIIYIVRLLPKLIPLHIIYFLSFFAPRSKKIWVFGSYKGIKFADNPKYLFLYINDSHQEKIKAVWISKNIKVVKEVRKNNLLAFYHLSPKGLYYQLRAKFYIYDSHLEDICFWLSGAAVKINTWHGIPIKNLWYKKSKGKLSMPKLKGFERFVAEVCSPQFIEIGNYFVATSTFTQGIISEMTRLEKSKILITGYPRNDILFDKNKISLRKLGINKKNKKIILYAPTFRYANNNPIQSPLTKINNLESIDKLMEKNNSLFLIKFHFLQDLPLENNNFHRIIKIDNQMDIYPFLSQVDLLITDYSSIFFDFLLLNRPIVFFTHDYKEYLKKEGLESHYENLVAGPRVLDINGLINEINFILNKKDLFIKKRREIKKLCFQHFDGNSSERLFNAIRLL